MKIREAGHAPVGAAVLDLAVAVLGYDLAENVVESRRVPIPIISVSVETKTTIIFPEGLTIEGEWVQVRTERRNFAELLDGISQGINIVGRFAADTDEAITHIIEAIARLRYFF